MQNLFKKFEIIITNIFGILQQVIKSQKNTIKIIDYKFKDLQNIKVKLPRKAIIKSYQQ